MAKKIVDAVADRKGNISKVRLSGNSTYTSIDAAVRMADKGQIDGAHAVHNKDGSAHLRTNPDDKKGNNLDDMAGEN